MKPYSIDFREKIVKAYEQGKTSVRKVAERFNVLGALNAVTHELITVTNDTYINAQSVCRANAYVS